MSDYPHRLPSPQTMAEMLAVRAWDDDVDDDTRLLCEMGSDVIKELIARTTRLALHLERAEALK